MSEPTAVVDTRLVLRPNASLSPRQALLAFAAVAGVSLAIAIGLTLMGFWPVLPFAGLEIAALGAAFWVSVRRNEYREVLDFCPETVRIQFGSSRALGLQASIDWQRAWVRVELKPGATTHAPTRLQLRCMAQSITLGRCLTDVERLAVHARIKQLLSPYWRMATAEVPGVALASKISTGE
jgi:uncharacterized membrane protein